jgi:tetratricopeptide (TPR) repeat protein
MDTKKLKNIRRTNAWKAAEWDYSGIIASYQFPLLGERPTVETMAIRMDEILETCPQFFPASLHRGQLYILEGKDDLAIQHYDQGFEMMRNLTTEKELIDTINNFIDFLENELRFDMCCKYLRQFIELFPQKALFYDYLAGDIARSKNENIFEIQQYFEPIMHKFIFKHGDIDDEIFDEIYNSLILFYDFLRKYKLVNTEDYK